MTKVTDVPGRNAKAIASLHPLMRPRAAAAIAEANAHRPAWLITDGYRNPEQQAALYAKGRTVPGEPCGHGGMRRAVGACKQHPMGAPVTWTIRSWHTCARAVDVAIVGSDGRLAWPDSPVAWQPFAEIAAAHGLEWGYAVWRKDMPHFMYRLDASGNLLTVERAISEWARIRPDRP